MRVALPLACQVASLNSDHVSCLAMQHGLHMICHFQHQSKPVQAFDVEIPFRHAPLSGSWACAQGRLTDQERSARSAALARPMEQITHRPHPIATTSMFYRLVRERAACIVLSWSLNLQSICL